MKLLLDQNLSFRLLEKLEPVYPGSTQVKFVGLDQADDLSVWQFAKDNGFTIVTKDADFHEFSLSDPAAEDALYDSLSIRRFVGVDLGQSRAPDETTICRFRRLLERNNLSKTIFEYVLERLESCGIKVGKGTIISAEPVNNFETPLGPIYRAIPAVRFKELGGLIQTASGSCSGFGVPRTNLSG